ncbi:DUF2071 domain-containing protein [Flavobacterium sp.]|uniref:YqjF family protein n=1 Tax=Flavobacterium sp. TaxID=239 RepID=UPI002BB0ACE7|nr:DUF2071 domain-containing protein [Flavobacterium sp.]HSD06238.1 DUF2071 domain-containing protein [Flavobacterium sp.]
MGKIKEILANTDNRQFPLPQKKWKYFQEWHHTIFLHWEIPVYYIEEFIPKTIKLDTFNNMAWISLVAFDVKNMRLRNLPPFPYISNFHEINVRTYVIKDGIPGIYMFSIETNKLIDVLLTRVFIGLPYQKSDIKWEQKRLISKNTENYQSLDINIGKTRPLAEKTALDLWLTERHALYETSNNKLYRFDIHHKEWELQNLDVTINDILYDTGKYSLTNFPDRIQYAEKLELLIWGKRLLD